MPMWILLACNLLNIVGNYMLIYGRWGAPELGLTGAGISTFVYAYWLLLSSWLYFCLIQLIESTNPDSATADCRLAVRCLAR